MLKRLRKSSGRVTLVLIGLASLGGCSGEGESRRDVYASREDCLADWGNKPEDCTPATHPRHSSSSSGSHYFYGPSYASRGGGSWGSDAGPARSGSRALSSVTGSHGGSSGTSRGGFGSTGHSSSG